MKLNPDAEVIIDQPGDFPVMIIDDFYADPEAVRDQALAADYRQAMAFYPGLHAPLTDAVTAGVVQQLCNVLGAVGDLRIDPASVQVDFSVITTPPEKLLANQQHPHIDPVPLFAILYLTPDIRTGTTFYRNKVTGLHKIVTEDELRRHNEFMRVHGETLDPGGYDLSHSEFWEPIYRIEGRYNRLVSYAGNVFHAVDAGFVPVPFDIRKARITQRFAFNAVHAN